MKKEIWKRNEERWETTAFIAGYNDGVVIMWYF